MSAKRKRQDSVTVVDDHTHLESSTSELVDPELVDNVDRLFRCNVGKQIPLPQLVVLGDQSSGKSSVLEGLMQLPFPRDMELCTRFATQITFPRSAEESVNISIIPAPTATQAHKDKLKAWPRNNLQNLTKAVFAEKFAKIVSEVCLISS
ncbi:MAG: dynamin family protein [Janthinobacterium lividum]